jgi:hypothetical protein
MKKQMLSFPLLADKAAEYSQDAAGLVQIIKSLPADQLRESYTGALRYIWIVMTVFGTIALIASLFTKAYPLDTEMETEQGFQEKRKSKDVEQEAQ